MNYNSKHNNILILFLELLMMFFIAFFGYKIYSTNTYLDLMLKNDQRMYLVADELRQSSDDLTHFARTYTVTNNLKYKQQYFAVLDIRSGKAARPKDYETIYWDLNKKTREARHPCLDKISLKERIKELPFTQEERDLLTLSEFNSNDLVNLEVQAFSLMDMLRLKPEKQALAISMLHSPSYYQAKHKIMNPIDKFMILLENRVKEEQSRINHSMKLHMLSMFASIILLIIANIYIYFYLKRKDKEEYFIRKSLEQKFQDLVNSSNAWTWEVNAKGIFTYSSDQVGNLLGYKVDEVIGKTPFDFMADKDKVRVGEIFSELVSKEKVIAKLENINLHKDGHKVYLLTSGSPYFDKDGVLLGYRGVDVDITSQKESEHSLEKKVLERTQYLIHQAHHDALTGLPNRVLFHDRLEHAIKEAKRNNTKLALLFIDLDHFKEINDSLGHNIGDKVLEKIALRLKKTIRDRDMIARLGGDEFTVILENLSQTQDASIIAEKLVKILSTNIDCKEIDKKLYVSNSIGISIYPDDGEDSQSLLKYADSAMYKAKDEGRNNYQYYSAEMTELAFERLAMEAAMREGIKNDEFLVYYQPQVNGATNKLIGMEALVRWQHPTMGIISPNRFIPLAESTGLVVELDRYVMKTAMTQLTSWYKNGLNPGVLAMNLAVKQLQSKDFIEMFENLLEETGCKSEWIELEVTETQIMTKPEKAIKILKYINNIGIELAVDDFGTGYSSLAYLKRLPIDKLKIDQAFVKDLPNDEEDSGIVKAVIALAKSLNLRIIAEGVETKEQRDFIVENGCENIQGYFYSMPIPSDKFEIILRDGFKG